MVKLDQQQHENQQLKKIESAFSKFSSSQQQQQQMNKNYNILKEQEQKNQQKEKKLTQLTQLIKLILTYVVAVYQINKLVLNSILQYVYGLVFKSEKFITNEIVLITGAGGYLGQHLSIEFAKRGAILVLLDISDEGLKKTSERLKSLGFNRIHTFQVDITNEQQIKTVSKNIKDKIGDVSMVVMNAAGRFEPKSIFELEYKDMEKQFQTSYVAQLWLIQEFLRNMIEKNHGHIATVSSSTAFLECSLVTAYSSFKLAQVKLLESVREELLLNNIQDVKTTICYLGLLKGGMANDFSDM